VRDSLQDETGVFAIKRKRNSKSKHQNKLENSTGNDGKL
jgi:hypothetical protein